MAVFRYWVSKEPAMVIPIDAIHYGAGFDAAGHWHEADYASSQEQEAEREMMAPVRGAVCALLVSGVLWVGLVAAARAVLTMVR